MTELGRHIVPGTYEKIGLKNSKGEWTIQLKNIPQGTSTHVSSCAFGWIASTNPHHSHIVAAFDPSIKDKSGAYLVDAQISEKDRYPYAASEENGIRLWELSEGLVGQKFII